MPNYTLQKISQIVGGSYTGEANTEITHLITDSRNLVSSVGAIFFAIRGQRHDGHNFIRDLYNKKGIRSFIIEEAPSDFNDLVDANFIHVKDSLVALQQIATFHRGLFKYPVIGITGSNGKTIVKEWLFHLMHHNKIIVRSPKSFNSQIGAPLSVWNMVPNADLAIFEAGISQHKEMAKLQPIINPDIGIFTNIGEAHQENFLSIQRKIREKLILFRDSKTIIFCLDHEAIAEEIEDWVNQDQQLLTWSARKEATLQVKEIQKSKTITTINALYQNETATIEIPFIDDASIENAIHCWLLMLHFKYSNDQIRAGMRQLMPVAMRLELKKGINNCTIINDSYNSDFYSLSIAIDFLNQQQQHEKKTLILSDILQSGKLDHDLYKLVSKLIANKKISKLVGIGTAIYANAHLFQCEKEFYLSTDDFINHFQPSVFQNEAVLLKGARSFEFERISVLLEQKAHRTIMEINLSAMVHNLNYFRSKLNPGTKIMVMVKAFSYGNGSFEIANILEYQKVDYLAVAFADEGITLRQAGIGLPIVVMNPEEASFRSMIEYQLEPEIYSFDQLKKYSALLNQLQISQYPVHIKLDTGMHRLGFMESQINDLCKELKTNQTLKVSSIFSHLVASDEPSHDLFTDLQVERFVRMSDTIIKQSQGPVYRHILNSMGIERFSKYQFEMVRLGIGLYGINPFNQDQLRNVSSLYTTISQIKDVLPGETVGYNRNGKVEKLKKIAVIPIGYADGYSRKLGNYNGYVWIKGNRAPIIGNICMDMCMIDITDLNINESDTVEIFGSHITLNILAELLGTIPYEVLTGIGSRVKRIYIQE